MGGHQGGILGQCVFQLRKLGTKQGKLHLDGDRKGSGCERGHAAWLAPATGDDRVDPLLAGASAADIHSGTSIIASSLRPARRSLRQAIRPVACNWPRRSEILEPGSGNSPASIKAPDGDILRMCTGAEPVSE